ncbi:MAG: ClbS/DfsB family four-helix bundle protein [Anaerolineae bacterium]|nr:ClbS/DfsB family four-helix bundle protein [Anaerolineae bacterium]
MHDELDQQKMLDLMQAEFAFVQRTLLLVPAHLMTQPNVQGKWSVKDTVAHLSAWHKRALRWIDMARRGEGVKGKHVVEPEPGFGWHQKDAINEKSYQEDKDRPLEDVLAEFQETYEQLYAETADSSDGELFGREGLSTFFRDPLNGYIVWNTYEHYKEHIPPIRVWLRDVGIPPS